MNLAKPIDVASMDEQKNSCQWCADLIERRCMRRRKQGACIMWTDGLQQKIRCGFPDAPARRKRGQRYWKDSLPPSVVRLPMPTRLARSEKSPYSCCCFYCSLKIWTLVSCKTPAKSDGNLIYVFTTIVFNPRIAATRSKCGWRNNPDRWFSTGGSGRHDRGYCMSFPDRLNASVPTDAPSRSEGSAA